MTLKRLVLLLSLVLVLVLAASYWVIRSWMLLPMLEIRVAEQQWHEVHSVDQWLMQQQRLLGDRAQGMDYQQWAVSALKEEPLPSPASSGELALTFYPSLILAADAHTQIVPIDALPIFSAESAFVRARLMPTMLPETQVSRQGMVQQSGRLYLYATTTLCLTGKQNCSLGYLTLVKELEPDSLTEFFGELGIMIKLRSAQGSDLSLPQLGGELAFTDALFQRELLVVDSLEQPVWVMSIQHLQQLNTKVEWREWIALLLIFLMVPASNYLIWKLFIKPLEYGSQQLQQMEREQSYRKLTMRPNVLEFQILVKAFNGLIGRVEKQREQLHSLSQTDALTGLANRRGMEQFTEREWQRLCRARYGMAVLMMDIDDFKAYNDKYGHQAGDDCLVAVSREIKRVARRGEDLACRYGGEEFCVVYVELKPEVALELAESIRVKVEALHKTTALIRRPVTISIGVSVLVPGDDADKQFSGFEQLIRIADQQLYLAKQQGKNRINHWLSCRDAQSGVDAKPK
ncbi:GGDEF domain-containing protein [Ferrimonas aestuarii]|uniref:diguanylate cyclase n=1 Tax=Ferrimonas aestuarii TaxID=2569539 RepID=A0A4U1BHB5_9GAMM|nr:diguanylate cyclase [Ferrimonas aestuarii]TKB50754.1 GGDEF domain-containing protein [Ferrimonas aestuarii]